jgi:hypothetical protein
MERVVVEVPGELDGEVGSGFDGVHGADVVLVIVTVKSYYCCMS